MSSSNNNQILTLDETEQAICDLLQYASNTMQKLSLATDNNNNNNSAGDIANWPDVKCYYETLQLIKQSLSYHIQNTPAQRNYKLNYYADYEQFLLSTQKIELINEKLNSIVPNNNNASNNTVHTNNVEMKQ